MQHLIFNMNNVCSLLRNLRKKIERHSDFLTYHNDCPINHNACSHDTDMPGSWKWSVRRGYQKLTFTSSTQTLWVLYLVLVQLRSLVLTRVSPQASFICISNVNECRPAMVVCSCFCHFECKIWRRKKTVELESEISFNGLYTVLVIIVCFKSCFLQNFRIV